MKKTEYDFREFPIRAAASNELVGDILENSLSLLRDLSKARLQIPVVDTVRCQIVLFTDNEKIGIMNKSKKAHVQDLTDRFGESNEEPVVARAPGRVNLIGGHTDYNDGFVLPLAIDYYLTVTGRRCDDQTVTVYSKQFDETHSFSLGSLANADDEGWISYVKGVVKHLTPNELGGMELLIDSEIPQGAGLSSSAALELAIATVFDAAYDLNLSAHERAIQCWQAENNYVGLNCGIMDQFAVTFGREDHALFLDCRTREIEQIPLETDDLQVLIVDTNVTHELVDSAYNQRREECSTGADQLAEQLDHDVTTLRDVSVEEFEAHQDRLSEADSKPV